MNSLIYAFEILMTIMSPHTLTLFLLSTLLATPFCRAEVPEKIPVLEQISCRLLPNRLSEFKVSSDGLSVAYTAGSGRFGDSFGGEEGPGWEYKKLIVNGRPEGGDNRWYENTRFVVRSPDLKHLAHVSAHYSTSGPSYIILNGVVQKSYGQVFSPQFSQDSKHLAYIATIFDPYVDSAFVVLDGKEGKRYGSVSWDRNLKFSPDSQRLAYVASNKKSNEYFSVVDGKEGKHYRWIDIYFTTFSPDSRHFAYAARLPDNKWTVVVDEIEGKHLLAEHISDLMFSPDSKQVAYITETQYGNTAFVVVGDNTGKQFRSVRGKIQFSFDSKHFAYAAQDGKQWRIVVDHMEGRGYDLVGQITYSPVDIQLAYVAYEGGKFFVVRDGVPEQKYDRITNLVFSPDGKTLAYAAYIKENRQWLVVINGRETPAYDLVLADNATEENGITNIVKGSSFQFESAESLRFLALRKKNVVMVRAHFGLDSNQNTINGATN